MSKRVNEQKTLQGPGEKIIWRLQWLGRILYCRSGIGPGIVRAIVPFVWQWLTSLHHPGHIDAGETVRRNNLLKPSCMTMKNLLCCICWQALVLLAPLVSAQPCSDIFISEYIEGTSFNKAIEIYNPTTGNVVLDGYRLYTFNNGSTVALFTHKLHGILGPGQVYVVCHPQADSLGIKVKADTISLVCNWNGNDAVALVNTYTGDTLDVIGEIGVDPGTSWPVDVGSTQNSTLVRKESVQSGTADWSLGQNQYWAYGVNTFSYLGSHTMDPCPYVPPSVFFLPDSTFAWEGEGTVDILVGILNPNNSPTTVEVLATGGSATAGTDFLLGSLVITFPAGSSASVPVQVEILDDVVIEPTEYIELKLINPSNNATVIGGQSLLFILDNDATGHADGAVRNVFIVPEGNGSVLHVRTPTNLQFHLSDVAGRSIMTKHLDPGMHRISCSHIPAGMYFVSWFDGLDWGSIPFFRY